MTISAGRAGREVDGVVETLALGHVVELAEQRAAQFADGQVGHLGGDGARLDLGQLEDAVEQVQQVVARSRG